MTVTLFTRKPMSAYASSSEVIVNYLNLDVKVEDASPAPNELFEKSFPANNRYTPSIYISDKDIAFNQQVAVNRYLVSLAKDNKGSLGKDEEDQYEISQWNSRVNSDIFPKFGPILANMFAGKTMNQKQVDGIVAAATRGFQVLEERLQKHTYLVGETFTLADLEAAAQLYIPFAFFVSEQWRKTFPAVTRWGNTILSSKAFQKRLGEFSFAGPESLDKFFSLTDAFKGKSATEKKPEKKTEKKTAKKQSKPKDDDEDDQPAPPKTVHPLAALGKSSIPIDELKRTYSNKETREEALPWFWNTFYNDEEWSLWKIDYKYNDELKMTFMTNNLIGGLFARLLASTKYMFGAAVVYGENNNNGIRGAFVVRGKDYFPAFEVAPDWESYEFTRLDASKPEDRAELEDLWAWDKPLIVNGEPREIADGKVLK